MKKQLTNLIRKEVQGQSAYATEIYDCPIRLDANENPFSIAPLLRREFIKAVGKAPLNRYPEAGSSSLLAGFAGEYGVDKERIIIGNGSDELIQILCISIDKTTVLMPKPTFAMYRISAINNGHRVAEIPLDDKFDLDVNAMTERIKALSPSLIFLSYPNNPTGNCFSRKKVEKIITTAPGFVVVDEAYGDFSGQSFIPLLRKYDNLVILKTLSKVGLAALRVGFLIGPPSLVRELNKVRLPYNLNSLSQVGAAFYLDHKEAFLDQAAEIVKNRRRLFKEMEKIKGIKPYPSDANFIFFSCLFDSNQVYNELRHQGILIKNFNAGGPIGNCMRVTVGSKQEIDAFLEALKSTIAGRGA